MNLTILPKSKDEWIALAVFPFKVWVLVALPFFTFFSAYVSAEHVRYGTTALGEAVISGYMLSILALLAGAVIQSIFCERGAATRTSLYAVASIVLVFTFYRF